MKYYEFEGKVYKSHNKEAITRRLFPITISVWGDETPKSKLRKSAKIRRLFGYNPKTGKCLRKGK